MPASERRNRRRLIQEESEEEDQVQTMDDQDAEESEPSELEHVLSTAEDTLGNMQKEIHQLKRLSAVLESIMTSKTYTTKEKHAIQDCFERLRARLQTGIVGIVDLINEAKYLFQEKQKNMLELHKEQILDEEVSRIWDKSLSEFGDRIEKLDETLAFLTQQQPDNTDQEEEEEDEEEEEEQEPPKRNGRKPQQQQQQQPRHKGRTPSARKH